MTDATQTLYLTKYALSEGILQVQARPIGSHGTIFTLNEFYGHFHLGTEVFLERDLAVQHARAMRLKRIASLKKSLAKLEATEFN